MIPLTWRVQSRQLTETESRRAVPGVGGDAGLAFNGDRAPVWEDENIQWVDGGDGCTTAVMCLMPLDATWKRSRW